MRDVRPSSTSSTSKPSAAPRKMSTSDQRSSASATTEPVNAAPMMRGSSRARARTRSRTASRSSAVNTCADVCERPSDDPLRHAGLIEVLRDAAEEEREAGAEEQAGVDVLRGRHHALLEQVAAFVGQCLEGRLGDLLNGPRPLLDDDDLVFALGEVVERRREREA